MHCINFYFECLASGTIVLNEESSEFRWVAASEVTDFIITFRNDEALRSFWRVRDGETGQSHVDSE